MWSVTSRENQKVNFLNPPSPPMVLISYIIQGGWDMVLSFFCFFILFFILEFFFLLIWDQRYDLRSKDVLPPFTKIWFFCLKYKNFSLNRRKVIKINKYSGAKSFTRTERNWHKKYKIRRHWEEEDRWKDRALIAFLTTLENWGLVCFDNPSTLGLVLH